MSVLIKGMEMPKEGSWKTVRIYPDGTCAIPNWQGDCTFLKGAQAVALPPHGRLIDADAVLRRYDYELSRTYTDDFAKGFQLGVKAAVGNGTAVVIEAEEE